MEKVKKHLKHLYFLNEELKVFQAKIEELTRASTTINSPSFDRVGSKTVYRTEAKYIRLIEKLSELKEAYARKLDEYITFYGDVRELIVSLENADMRLIMKYRYIHFMKWEEISDKLKLSNKHVYRLHNQALMILSKGFEVKGK